MTEVLQSIKGFEWNKGNSGKNEAKHGVTDRECEEIFFNEPLVVEEAVSLCSWTRKDIKHTDAA